jgi:hypothetical protein
MNATGKLSLILIVLLLYKCSPQFITHFIEQEEVVFQEIEKEPAPEPCWQSINFAPDEWHPDHTPMQYLKVNFHVMRRADGTGNFTKVDARAYIDELLGLANDRLSTNSQMLLPRENDLPLLETRYRYVLAGMPGDPDDDGIYFHDDNEHCWYNVKGEPHSRYSRDVFEKYAIQKTVVLNIFMQEHIPDSIASPTYRAKSTGISFGEFVKLASCYHHANDTLTDDQGNKYVKGAGHFAGLLNHEIGHCLGLNHTWNQNDGCDDTPKHSNCWNWTAEEPCRSSYSNNMMDYNAFQNAVTPCQLGRIHSNFNRDGSRQRKKLVENWCNYKPDATIVIKRGQNIQWYGGKDLEGDIVVNSGGELTIGCTVSLPEKARVTVNPGGKLILDEGMITNRCGQKWEGIEIAANEGTGEKGEVIFINGASAENVEHPIVVTEKDMKNEK